MTYNDMGQIMKVQLSCCLVLLSNDSKNQVTRQHVPSWPDPYTNSKNPRHDDIIKWKHFPHYWPFVLGIHRSPVNSPHKGQWCRTLMCSLICTWINDWVKNREAGDLKCHHTHYDVIVMTKLYEAMIIHTHMCTYHNSGQHWYHHYGPPNKDQLCMKQGINTLRPQQIRPYFAILFKKNGFLEYHVFHFWVSQQRPSVVIPIWK